MKRSDIAKLDRKMGGIRFDRSLLHTCTQPKNDCVADYYFNRGNYFPNNTQSFFKIIKLGTSK